MFSSNSRNAMSSYRKVGVESLASSAAPHQLVLMLFNGARAAVAMAKGHMQRKETSAKCEAISKAIAIVDGGLKASLDLNVGGKLAQNLSDLYAYMSQRLLEANLKNDGNALDEVAQLLEQLGSAWETIAAKPAVAAAPAAIAAAAATAHPPAATRTPLPSTAPAPAAVAPAATAAPLPSAAPARQTPQSRRLAAAYGAI